MYLCYVQCEIKSSLENCSENLNFNAILIYRIKYSILVTMYSVCDTVGRVAYIPDLTNRLTGFQSDNIVFSKSVSEDRTTDKFPICVP